MNYQFPPTRFTKNSLWRQWFHLLSEVLEVGLALLQGDLEDAAREVWDAKQCSETLHRILWHRRVDITEAKVDVVLRCKRRGYYGNAKI